MYNRELIKATVQYFDGVDEYGQQLSNQQKEKQVELAFGLYQHTKTDDVRYQNITHYALTKDRTITDKCYLVIDGKKYKVMFVNDKGRLVHLLCQL